MGQFDIALRYLAARHAPSLAHVLAPTFPVQSATWIETQHTARERRLDKALELRGEGHCRRLHLEIAVDAESALPRRIYEYAAYLTLAEPPAPLTSITSRAASRPASALPDAADHLLAAAADIPVESALILLSGRRRPWPREGHFRISPPGASFSGHCFQIEAVYQRTIDELWARPGTFWLVFTPLARNANIESISHVLEELARREPDKHERAALHGAMFVLANLDPWQHHLGEEIKRMLSDLDIDDIMASPAFREVFEQGEKRGHKRGHDEGFDEGVKRGVHNITEELIRALLVHHLRRDLTPAERSTVTARAATLDPPHTLEVLRLDADALHTWLFGPDAE